MQEEKDNRGDGSSVSGSGRYTGVGAQAGDSLMAFSSLTLLCLYPAQTNHGWQQCALVRSGLLMPLW